MKIYTATSHFLSSVRNLFTGHTVEVLPKDYRGLTMDLLIFTGGEDIHPRRYGANVPGGSTWFNEERDEQEFQIMQDYLAERFHTKKILGICRGLQFLNVFMGGSLIYDIERYYGKGHSHTHKVSWHTTNLFMGIELVNSLHHQGILSVGESQRYNILATEPATSIIEAITWGSSILAFQFHPEMWSPGPEKTLFNTVITGWVEGKNNLLKEISPRPEKPSLSKKYIETFRTATASETAANAFLEVLERDPNIWMEDSHDIDSPESDEESDDWIPDDLDDDDSEESEEE